MGFVYFHIISIFSTVRLYITFAVEKRRCISQESVKVFGIERTNELFVVLYKKNSLEFQFWMLYRPRQFKSQYECNCFLQSCVRKP